MTLICFELSLAHQKQYKNGDIFFVKKTLVAFVLRRQDLWWEQNAHCLYECQRSSLRCFFFSFFHYYFAFFLRSFKIICIFYGMFLLSLALFFTLLSFQSNEITYLNQNKNANTTNNKMNIITTDKTNERNSKKKILYAKKNKSELKWYISNGYSDCICCSRNNLLFSFEYSLSLHFTNNTIY